MPGFSLLTLFAVVTIAAVNFAGVKYAPNLWASTVLTVALGMLGVAGMGAAYRQREKRAFWVGFTLFGGAYLALTLGPWFGAHVGKHMVTSAALDRIWDALHVPSEEPDSWLHEWWHPTGFVSRVASRDGERLNVLYEDGSVRTMDASTGKLISTTRALLPIEDLRLGGHSLFALLVGLVGGLVGRGMCRMREETL